jgi:hypothetical protein
MSKSDKDAAKDAASVITGRSRSSSDASEASATSWYTAKTHCSRDK